MLNNSQFEIPFFNVFLGFSKVNLTSKHHNPKTTESNFKKFKNSIPNFKLAFPLYDKKTQAILDTVDCQTSILFSDELVMVDII